MSKRTYAELEKYLPTLIKAELQTDAQREVFAEEFGERKKSKLKAYLFILFLSAHRWYISGKPGLTVLQWVLNICVVGLAWIIWDLFQIPKLVRTRNNEIAKNILVEQRMIGGSSMSNNQAQPSIINISNNVGS